ncbi:hypothetical protein Poly30_20280 [Planctomycetes bacterium Poly30]|uniref:ACT domain-containing protein n=1 Tax=Saltatorellus ferox TaxID=2528018 RepID=A0A518ER04_9BACT|nr:hypothetical protein Poly30_20280 [Planctomycetes bacterium Poly30]
MTKRFLTAEDVRRLGGPEIQLESGTVVTPQAAEVAAAAGIRLVGATGPYVPPIPDRGPDASRANDVLPEPISTDGIGLIVTVVGRNRPGVLAEVTATLAAAECDVIDISQRTVGAHFHMVLTCAVAPGREFAPIKDTLQCLGGEGDYVVRVMHEKVFRFMHRV